MPTADQLPAQLQKSTFIPTAVYIGILLLHTSPIAFQIALNIKIFSSLCLMDTEWFVTNNSCSLLQILGFPMMSKCVH